MSPKLLTAQRLCLSVQNDVARARHLSSSRDPWGVASRLLATPAMERGRGALSVLHVFVPSPVGGLEAVVRGLARGASGAGIDASVAVIQIVPAPEPVALYAELKAAGVACFSLPVSSRGYWRERAAVRALCRRLRPDLVHTHGYRADVVDAPVVRRLHTPVVTTVHGFTGGDWRNRAYEWLQRHRFRRFDAVVAVSRPLAECLARSGVPRARLHFVQNAWSPVAAPLERVEARRRLGVAPEGFRIGWVGRLSPEKGPDRLVAALAALGDRQVALSLVGDGPQRAALSAEVARLGLEAQVTFHGTVAEAARLYRAFDVFVLSSRTEGTPIVLFEAMGARVPIVATSVGGVPDVIGPAEALLVAPEEPAALATAIRAVQRDPSGAALRAEGAARRLDAQFAPEPWILRYREIYDQVTESAQTAPS